MKKTRIRTQVFQSSAKESSAAKGARPAQEGQNKEQASASPSSHPQPPPKPKPTPAIVRGVVPDASVGGGDAATAAAGGVGGKSEAEGSEPDAHEGEKGVYGNYLCGCV